MPVASPSTRPAAPTTRRRLSERLLGSSLLDALAGPHGVDRYLELVRPAWTLRDARAEIVAVERQTADSVTLQLRPNVAWNGHEAGQFVQLAVEIDGVRRTRCYSPAGSAADTRRLELTIKRHPEGLVSEFLNERARPGMVVGLSAADGDFKLPASRPSSLLLVSGGSGITPVLSILRTLCDEGGDQAITFLHYAPDAAAALYGDELAELAARHPNLRLVRAFTRSAEGELEGYFSRDHIAEAAPDYATAEAFVCGPPGLVEAARAIWAEDQLEHRLHIESFLPPALAIRSDSAEGVIRFADSGLEVANSGRSILEQAEEAGLRPVFGCRMGICHSCSCRKTAGSVRNLLSDELSSDEDEEIRICVSAPAGDVEIEL